MIIAAVIQRNFGIALSLVLSQKRLLYSGMFYAESKKSLVFYTHFRLFLNGSGQKDKPMAKSDC